MVRSKSFAWFKFFVFLGFFVSLVGWGYYSVTMSNPDKIGAPKLTIEYAVLDELLPGLVKTAMGYPMMPTDMLTGVSSSAPSMKASDVEKFKRYADVFMEIDRDESSLNGLRELHEIYPQKVEVGINLAIALARMGRWGEAYAIISPVKAGGNSSGSPLAAIRRYNAGVAAFHAGRKDQALNFTRYTIRAFRQAGAPTVSKFGVMLTQEDAYFALCEAYQAYDRADYRGEKELNGVPPEYDYLKGIWKKNQWGGKTSAVENYLTPVLRNISSDPRYRVSVAGLLLKEGMIEKALPLLEEAWEGMGTTETYYGRFVVDRLMLAQWLSGRQDDVMRLAQELSENSEGRGDGMARSVGKFFAFSDLLRVLQAAQSLENSDFGEFDRRVEALPPLPYSSKARAVRSSLETAIRKAALAQFATDLQEQANRYGETAISKARERIENSDAVWSREAVLKIVAGITTSDFSKTMTEILAQCGLVAWVFGLLYLLMVVSQCIRLRKQFDNSQINSYAGLDSEAQRIIDDGFDRFVDWLEEAEDYLKKEKKKKSKAEQGIQ